MKAGGLYNALKIASAAEVYGVECMLGCMLEAKVSVNAAIHLACARQVITKSTWTVRCFAPRIPSSAARCSMKRTSRFPTSRGWASRGLKKSPIWTDYISPRHRKPLTKSPQSDD